MNDQAARNMIHSRFDLNLLVEAGAGSGKTTSLTDRMVEAVATGHVRVEHMAAITFTRKAANRLKEKFQEDLEKGRHIETDPVRAVRMEEALQHLHRCFIGTIHSFCASMLRERPVEAGINPDFTELDETGDRLAQSEAWEQLLAMLKIENPLLLEELAAIGVDPLDLKIAAQVRNAFPEVRVYTERVEKPDLQDLRSRIDGFLVKVYPHLPDKQPEKGWDALQDTVRKARRMIDHYDLESDAALMGLAAVFDRTLGVTLNRWPDKEVAKELRDITAPLFRENVIKPALKQWQAHCHPVLTKLVEEASVFYRQLRRQKGWVNFQDLLLTSTEMLRDNPEVRGHFANKYRCLLVDEFQDTDPVQAEMLLYLTGDHVQERDWTKITPRPGSLFLVGDPKQSIYRFRRADIDTYHQMKNLIEYTGGQVLTLTTNFRSLHALGRHLNPLFQEILPETATPEQAAYAPMETRREGEEDCLQGVLVNAVSPEFRKKEEIVGEDARRIAALIRQWVDEQKPIGKIEAPAQYGDFLILTRYRDSLTDYTQHLEAEGIPYRVTGSSVFAGLPEVQELMTLLTCLDQPDDAIATVAVLRGLFFGFSDDDLYQYKRQGGSFRWRGFQGDESMLNGALHCLQNWRKELLRLPFSVALEKILDETDMFSSAWLEEGGRVRCGHLVYLLEVVKQEEAAGNTSVQGIMEQLNTLMEIGVEEELDITGEVNVVRVMNLHKAKGLEAPVVFLAHPYKQVSRSPDYHIHREGNEVTGHFVYTIPTSTFGQKPIGKTLNWEMWEEIESTFLTAEEDRLLYVAATRAESLLVISSCGNNSKNPWARLLKDLEEKDMVEPENSEEKEPIAESMPVFQELEYDDWVMKISRATYSTMSPTADKKAEEMWQVGRKEGGGAAWGMVVHRLLEYMVLHRLRMTQESLKQMPFEKWVTEIDLPAESMLKLWEAGELFLNSDLWERLLQADDVHEEVPFHLWVTQDHPLAHCMPEDVTYPVYYSGIIDLVFREKNNWIIVDYKTDQPENDTGYAVLEKVYQRQLQQYKAVWEYITGDAVNETAIYFLYR